MNAQPASLGAAPPRGAPPSVARPAGPPRRSLLDRILSPVVLTIYAVAIGLGLGLGSAYVALRGSYPFGAVAIGPWVAWPSVGSGKADPYARAITARRSDIPLALGEGLELVATRDTSGAQGLAGCTYRLGALIPQTRLWTLSVYDGAGRPIETELKRSGFTSAEIVHRADETFTIVLSRQLQPGNWIQLPASGDIQLGLRLYDMPGIGGAVKLGADDLPSIERLECRP